VTQQGNEAPGIYLASLQVDRNFAVELAQAEVIATLALEVRKD
jgi:hypothetical protein